MKAEGGSAGSAAGARCDGEGVEVGAPTSGRRAEPVVGVEVVDQDLAHAGQFSESPAVSGIGYRQVEQLEGALNRSRAVLGVAPLLPVQRPFDLAAGICHLFNQTELEPPAG